MFKWLIGLVLVLVMNGCSWLNTPPSRAENPIVKGVSYVGITVSDLARSSSLYQEAAGLQVNLSEQIVNNDVFDQLANRKGVKVDSQLMSSVNSQLRLMEFYSPSEQAVYTSPLAVFGPGIAHVCYQVNQKTQTYQKFLEGGATPIGASELVQISSRNPVYYGYAHDHDDILFEVEHVDVESLMEKLELPEPPKNDQRIRHVSLATNNMERLIDFYSVLLETNNPRRAGNWFNLRGEKLDMISGHPDSKIEMAWFQIRNLELEIIQYHQPVNEVTTAERPIDALGYNMIVFDVDDLEAVRGKLLEAGGKIEVETSPMDSGEVLFARDPDGNLLGFQKLDADHPLSAKKFVDNGSH